MSATEQPVDGHANGAPDSLPPLPLDRTSPQLTLRAILTGMFLGALLSCCNIYTGLKVGLLPGMSITAALLGYALWMSVQSVTRVRKWTILENNISQTVGSSSAAVASAGLIGPIPVLARMTGHTLPWHLLALWIFSVCLVGITVAIALRRPLVIIDKLPFADGTASATTLRELYAKGSAGLKRAAVLIGAALIAAQLKLLNVFTLAGWKLPGVIPASVSIRGFAPGFPTFGLHTSLFLYAIGGLIGFRVGAAILLGSIAAWGVLAPTLVEQGYVRFQPGAPGTNYVTLVKWLVWPGTTIMVVAALTTLAFSWRSIIAAFTSVGTAAHKRDTDRIGRHWFLVLLGVALPLCVVLQVVLFGIPAWIAVLAVLLAFALAVVAARVSGETSIGISGPIVKVAQVAFCALRPNMVAPNLMAANVAGGAAAQCSDLLHDLKCGHLLGAAPRRQFVAQLCGALTGALAGSAAYLMLIPNAAAALALLGKGHELPAPSVVQLEAVAEAFQSGFANLPTGTPLAMLLAAAAGVGLTLLERLSPPRIRRFVPSPVGIGLAFVVPANVGVSIFIGAAIALLAAKIFKNWCTRYLITVCAGIIVGESLTGVGLATFKALSR